jgi:adenylyl-sulfate kinase
MTPELRAQRNGHRGGVIWLTGLSGAGKTTLAVALEQRLFADRCQVYRLDGDELRRSLSADLGFSAADRSENIRRAAAVAALLAEAGVICIAAFISPLRADRERARQLIQPHRFVEVHVATPVEVCRRRDPKGLYARADRGEIRDFTGVSAPYEQPEHAEVLVQPATESVATCVERILQHWRGP